MISDKPANEEVEVERVRLESTTKKSIKQNTNKADLLNKKSQYYFKKQSQKSFHDFNYSKTAENTLRNNGNLTNLNINLSTINSNNKLVQKEGFECQLFTS